MRYMYRKGHLDNQLGGQIKRGDTRIRWLSGNIDKTKKNRRVAFRRTLGYWIGDT